MSAGDPRPLVFLDIDPFSGLLPPDNSSPDEIIRSGEEACSAAHAVATTLWRWHPSALRAFLDYERFYTVEWISHQKTPEKDSTLIIARHSRHITLGTYKTKTLEWKLQATYQMPLAGPWIPLAGYGSVLGDAETADDVMYLGDCIGRGLLRKECWEPEGADGYIELCIGDNLGRCDRGCSPQRLYHARSKLACTVCKQRVETRLEPMAKCPECGQAKYCSIKCRELDENVHKGLCSARRPRNYEHGAVEYVPAPARITGRAARRNRRS